MQRVNERNSVNVKKIYFWNIAGSVANALTSMILLMIVTRTSDSIHADMFSIGFALAQQFVTIGMFQVRNYQATDVKEKFVFKDYFSFRVLTCIVMTIVSMLYIFMKGYSLEKGGIVFLLCMAKVVEAFSDAYQGSFQQKERLDIAGKTLALRSVTNCLVFGITMVLFPNVLLAVCSMLIGSFSCYWFYERPRHRGLIKKTGLDYCLNIYIEKWKSIFRQCLPLFINGYLIMTIFNAPKNAIDNLCGQNPELSGMQTDYNILFMPAFVINMFMIFLRPYMTQMAYAWVNHQSSRFRKLLAQMIAGILAFSGVTMAGAYLLGIPVLGVVYGRDLSQYRPELLILVLGGAFNSLATVFDNVITVIRRQHHLVISYVITWLMAQGISRLMVVKQGITGAALTFLFSMMLLTLCNMVILIFGLRRRKEKNE